MMVPLDCPLCGSREHREVLEKSGFHHVRCRDCRFVFVNPQPADDAAENARLYGDDHASWGPLKEQLSGLTPEELAGYLDSIRRRRPKRTLADLSALEKYKSTGRLLDLGCGPGFFLLAARDHGWDVAGVDVAEASARIGREFFDLPIQSGIPGRDMFPPASFDVVRANQVVEHLKYPRPFLETASHFLRPGGALLLTTINFRSATRLALGSTWRHLGDGHQGHVSFFEPKTLRGLLGELGFDRFEFKTMGFRLRNPDGQRPPRWRRTVEKSVGALAGPAGWGGRLKVTATKRHRVRDRAAHGVRGAGAVLGGLGALTVLPLLILVDFLRARGSGWSLESAGERWTLIGAGAVLGAATVTACFPRGRQFLASRCGQFGLLAAATCTALLIGEGVLRLSLQPMETFRRFHRKAPGSHFVSRPSPAVMPGVSGDAHYRTDVMGLRGTRMQPDAGDYRVLCVGGSTTICQYLDDEETWPHLLGSRLSIEAGGRVWVGNAGKNGYNTIHHLRFLRTCDLLDEMDCVLFLVGVNDLSIALSGSDVRIRDGLPPLWRRSHWGEAVATIARSAQAEGNLEVEDEAGEVYTSRRRRRQNGTIAAEAPDLTAGLRDFETRIRAMISIAKEHQLRAVFLSQPVLWDESLRTEDQELLWFGRLSDGRYLAVPELRHAMDRYNHRLQQICAAEGVEFVNLAAMHGRPEFFYDDCHFSEAGARELARLTAVSFQPLRGGGG